ncbi:MAG: hypothetical protein JW819_12795 [Candidatus Krumholzibacteriota bacterium]|nr:hypothetical protein [Candidatus Krumholzibacteriota bacterium]
MKRMATILAAGLVLLAAAAGAEVPRLINYQGILTDEEGDPLEGTHTLSFSVYADSGQGAAALWTERHENVPVERGLFNMLLGGIMDIPPSLFAGGERWLGVTVDTDPEVRPRMRIAAVAYALRAAVADSSLGGGSADADWLITGDDMVAGVAGNVGIGATAPARRLQVGDTGIPDAEGMIRLASRSGTQGSNRAWDIGVPETDSDTSGPGYSFVIDDTQAGDDPEFMVKYGTGHVGIGTTAPAAPLEVVKPTDSTADAALQVTTRYLVGGYPMSSYLRVDRTAIDGATSLGDANVNVNGTSAGNVYLAAGGGDVGVGTTQPDARLDVAGDLRADAIRCDGHAYVDILHITGADLAERFPASEAAAPGTVVAIDPARPGELCVCREAYDRRVAGVVSGARGLPAGAVLGGLTAGPEALPVALSGRVWVRADATGGPIAPGDLLTSAATPGHAMAARDAARAQGAVLGKAMTALDAGTGWVLALVNLQ